MTGHYYTDNGGGYTNHMISDIKLYIHTHTQNMYGKLVKSKSMDCCNVNFVVSMRTTDV